MQRNETLKEKLVSVCEGWLQSPIDWHAKFGIKKFRDIIQSSNEGNLLINVASFCSSYSSMLTATDTSRIMAVIIRNILLEHRFSNKIILDPQTREELSVSVIRAKGPKADHDLMQKFLPYIKEAGEAALKERTARKAKMAAATFACYALLQGRSQSEFNTSPIKRLPFDVIKIIMSYMHPFNTDKDECEKFSNSVHSYFQTARTKIAQQREEAARHSDDCRLM